MFNNNQSALFIYPAEFVTLPEYSARRNQIVTILRPCTLEEADGPAQGEEQMYVIQAADGWIGHAWESELKQVPNV